MLLGAFTNWEPKDRGPRDASGLREGERPIPGVDYQQNPARGFDNLPLAVQSFISSAKSLKPPDNDHA